jgi:hypothetical protein
VPGKGDVLELEPDLLADDLATGRRGVEGRQARVADPKSWKWKVL